MGIFLHVEETSTTKHQDEYFSIKKYISMILMVKINTMDKYIYSYILKTPYKCDVLMNVYF